MDCKKSDFNLDTSYTYLNCAYMSPQLNTVEKAGIEGVRRKRNPFKISAELFFDETETLRKEYAKLINASEPRRIVVIPSVSYGMANVARNLPLSRGENIIVADEQFPSNIYPWRSLADDKNAEIITVTPPAGPSRGKRWNEMILESINPKTKMVAIGNVHWADGTLFDLKQIRKRTRDVGAWLVIDGTQSVGALPIDVEEIEPDALICAGYKWLMGPYSIGLAYYGPAMDDGKPVEENWINRYESENFAGLVNYSDRYQPGALRYEVGEHSNFILVPMMLTAVKHLNEWGVENIQAYCRDLISKPVKQLREAGFRIEDENHRSAHLFGVRLSSHHNMEDIKKALETNHILVSVRGDSIRVSPNVYNTQNELRKFAETLV
ncbi:aminotransferase class V-fold PLP-dependent enzyme [Rhodohalobacter sp. SW132]|uniref:aminotransferase class V-fold PLP-dependent enzyme n=1 Tax=Rhodohalobacter sp. SW132 TaxID=2293433 RepID=UPI000E2768F7|nr:aminotransferase class V-fold PLP-dependent enzyme [Rhodohalobacter sp. SW132]REL38984.1 aminotransferase class V-fold PLP-dependent enzyme [Rhodohalobacter sp. SW132]